MKIIFGYFIQFEFTIDWHRHFNTQSGVIGSTQNIIGNNEKSNLSRIKISLNIQWAIDIAAQFPQNQENKYLYNNLESWLYKIKDEDDREQIELWARQVAKGKITEDEFVARIGELNDWN